MVASRILLYTTLALGSAFLLLSGDAKADEPEPLPPQAPNPSNPPDDMPWMRFSEATQTRQEEYNDWATANGWPTIKEDGILGPATCKALTDWWTNGGGPAVPSACSNAARYQVCQEAAAVRAEYLRLDERIARGEGFSSDEQHLQQLWDELYRLERMCGEVLLTGSGTRVEE